MANIFDRIYQQQHPELETSDNAQQPSDNASDNAAPAQPQGNIFERIQRQQQQNKPPAPPQPAITPTEGYGPARFIGGLWDNTVGGAVNTIKALGDLVDVASNRKTHLEPETANLLHNVVQAHVDQYYKMLDAWNRGEHVEAAGHALGMIPLVGPAAAAAGEQIGGSAPVFDKYGNVIQPGHEPDPWGGGGAGLGLVLPSATRLMPASVAARLPNVRVPGFNRATPEVQSAVRSLMETGAPEERIPGNTAAVTGSPYLKHMQTYTGMTPVGAFVEESAEQGTRNALKARAERLEEQAAPGTPAVPGSAGAEVQAKLAAAAEEQKALADTHYDAVRAAEQDPANVQMVDNGATRQVGTGTFEPDATTVDSYGNFRVLKKGAEIMRDEPVLEPVSLPVDMRGLKQQMRPIYDEISKTWPPTQRLASPGYTALGNMLEGDDFVPLSEADRNLGALKKLARDAPPGPGQGLAKFVIQPFQDLVDRAAEQGGADVRSRLGAARDAVRTQHYIEDELLQPLQGEPVGAFGRLTWGKDAGADLAQKVAQVAPQEMRAVGRAWLNNQFTRATAEGAFQHAQRMWAQWRDMGPITKNLLFGPQMTQELNNFFLGNKTVAENINPSGSGKYLGAVGTLGWALTHPATGVPAVLGTGAMSKLFRSTLGVKLFTEGLRVPLGAADAAARYAQIARLAGLPAWQQPPATVPPTGQAKGGLVLPPTLRRLPTREDSLRALGQ